MVRGVQTPSLIQKRTKMYNSCFSKERRGGGLKDKTVVAVLCFSASLTILSTALSCLISGHTKQLIIRTMGLYSFIILETINWRSNVISVINCSAASGHFRDLFQLICSRRSSWRSQRDTKLLQTLGRMILFIFHRPCETYPDLYWWLKCTATIAEGLRRTSREKAPCLQTDTASDILNSSGWISDFH